MPRVREGLQEGCAEAVGEQGEIIAEIHAAGMCGHVCATPPSGSLERNLCLLCLKQLASLLKFDVTSELGRCPGNVYVGSDAATKRGEGAGGCQIARRGEGEGEVVIKLHCAQTGVVDGAACGTACDAGVAC